VLAGHDRRFQVFHDGVRGGEGIPPKGVARSAQFHTALVMGNWFPSGNRLYQLLTQPETGLNRFLTYSATFSRK
jgi:hypothetical protein